MMKLFVLVPAALLACVFWVGCSCDCEVECVQRTRDSTSTYITVLPLREMDKDDCTSLNEAPKDNSGCESQEYRCRDKGK